MYLYPAWWASDINFYPIKSYPEKQSVSSKVNITAGKVWEETVEERETKQGREWQKQKQPIEADR